MLKKDMRDKMADKVKAIHEEEEAPEEGHMEIEVLEIGAPMGDLSSELKSLVDSWSPTTDEGAQYKEDVEALLPGSEYSEDE
tara:strand:+ start:1056 stop:1301 length:246 start_codon:yes stop_codon:yes gene_type:complete